MARIAAFIPDLLFGSSVLSALQAAGHEVELTGSLERAGGEAELVIVDLTADAPDRAARVREQVPPATPVLAFYAHVEVETRELARRAGFALVVPRSRMAREGPALVARLLDERRASPAR